MGRKLTESELQLLDPERRRRIHKCRRYYAENRERLTTEVRKYQQRNRAEIVARKKRAYYTEAAHRAYLDKVYGKGAADHYYKQLQKQDGKCVGCGKKTVRRLAQDHHSISGQLRGALCATHCNRILGYARENPEVLRRLADYLEWWESDRF